MKRSILLTCTGLLLAACASGADVAQDDASSPDSAAVDVLDEAPPGEAVPDKGEHTP